jgi:nitrate/nitrite-specific signal transduction histidine kinase
VEPPGARILITDDGRGLQSPRADSMGIRGMRERAARIGALLSIGPAMDGERGTSVEVVLEGSVWGRVDPFAPSASVADDPEGRERVAP